MPKNPKNAGSKVSEANMVRNTVTAPAMARP